MSAILTTGDPGLDLVLGGGLHAGSLVVLAGVPGSGKTILAQQIVFANATDERGGVYYTTWSEPHDKLVEHLEPFDFFDAAKLGVSVDFVHLPAVLPQDGEPSVEPLLGEVLANTLKRRPAVVVVDSSKALHDLRSETDFRRELYELAGRISYTNAVLMLVGEYTEEEFETEPEFAIADAIIRLENEVYGPVDRRWLRVQKLRGADSMSGRHTFVLGGRGLRVFPRLESYPIVEAELLGGRASFGVEKLDALSGGGLPRGESTLVLGPAGVGKTALALQFVQAGLAAGERALYVTLQETPDQLLPKAAAFGWDLAGPAASGQVRLVHIPPVEIDVDQIAARIREELDRAPADRVVIESLAEISFAIRETERLPAFVYSLVALLRARGSYTIITSEVEARPDVDRAALPFLFQNVLMLRYVEQGGEILRSLNVVKMRDSAHAKGYVEFEVGPAGFQVGRPH